MKYEKFIERKNFLTSYADIKELNFVNIYKGNVGKYIDKWRLSIIKRSPIVSVLNKEVDFNGDILEVGAGSCWFSAELSKLSKVNHIYSLDFSKRALKEVAPSIFKILKAEENKITRILGDYHQLPFEDNLFDFVVIDAALHHTNYLEVLLKEIKRVLKNNGKVIAIREPIKSVFWPIKKKLNLVDRPVKKYGMIENTYTKDQWIKYFNDAEFSLNIKPIFYKGDWKENLIRLTPFRFFNGFLFSRYYFRAIRK